MPESLEAVNLKVGQVKLNRFGKSVGKPLGMALTATAIAAMTLTACGSDNNTATPSSSASGSGSSAASASGAAADCGGKNSLTGEGSTAQQNAIALFNQVWGQTCSGKTLSYNPTGSGAGVTQFIAKQVDFAGSDSSLAKDQVDPAAAAVGATRHGTCRWCSAPSPWVTTCPVSTSSS